METTILLSVAGGAILLAILIWLFKRPKSQSSQLHTSTMGVPSVKPLGPPPPMPPPARKIPGRKYRNRKGWSAPIGHFFDDDDRLFTDTGDMITDMLLIANLCGIDDYVSIDDPVDTETIESEPVSEVTPSSDFSDLQTAPSAPVSVPEPSYTPSSYGGGDSGDSGGGYDSGGCDSGGSDD